jgi:hypothetical protein
VSRTAFATFASRSLSAVSSRVVPFWASSGCACPFPPATSPVALLASGSFVVALCEEWLLTLLLEVQQARFDGQTSRVALE